MFYPSLLELRCYIFCQNFIGETGLTVLTARSLSQEERGSYRDLELLDILFQGEFSGIDIFEISPVTPLLNDKKVQNFN